MSSNATRQFLVQHLRAYLACQVAPLPASVDWDALLELAAFHHLEPLLHKSLREGRGDGHSLRESDCHLAKLDVAARANASRSLILTGELLRLLKRLDAAGIAALPFKGPTLAVQLYGDPALRDYKDLDVLVRPADFTAAKQALVSLGYRFKTMHTFHAAFALDRGQTEVEVELHWSFIEEDFPLRLDVEGVWERRAAFILSDAQTSVLAAEDLLLYLCVHGSKHLWLRLQWLCDIAQLLRGAPALDWDRLLERAEIAGGQRALFLGLSLANEILGAPLPPAIEKKARQDQPVAKLARQVHWRLFEGPYQLFKPWRRISFHLQLIDRGWERLTYSARYWLRAMAVPNEADWNALPLPKALFPLYYLLRPVRLAGKYSRSALSHVFNRPTEI